MSNPREGEALFDPRVQGRIAAGIATLFFIFILTVKKSRDKRCMKGTERFRPGLKTEKEKKDVRGRIYELDQWRKQALHERLCERMGHSAMRFKKWKRRLGRRRGFHSNGNGSG